MTQQNTRQQPDIAAGIVVRERRILMVRRQVSEDQLACQFPAGEVEPGEAREAAAVRKTQEKTGLTMDSVNLRGARSSAHRLGRHRRDVERVVTYAKEAIGLARSSASGYVARRLQAPCNEFGPLGRDHRVGELGAEIAALSTP